MSACNCSGGANCCRMRQERRTFDGLIERKEYWPDGQLKSWTFHSAAPDAAAPLVPSEHQTIRFDWGTR